MNLGDTSDHASDEATAKANFYLRNRDDIEEWAKLRAEARELINNALLNLDEAVAALAGELGCEVYFGGLDDGIVTIWRSEWSARTTSEVSVGFGWDTRRILTPGNYTEWAWVGAFIEARDSPRGRAFSDVLKPLRQRHGYAQGNPWSLWRAVTPSPGSVQPDEYATKVLSEMRAAWEQISPTLTRN